MEENSTSNIAISGSRKFSGMQVFGIVIFAMIVTVVITLWIVATDIFVSEFTPVTLNDKEQQTLSNKLKRITDFEGDKSQTSKQPNTRRNAENLPQSNSQRLEPEAYSEEDADRVIHLTEKEINAMLANNTNLATRLAIDLSGNLVSAKYLLPLDEELPVLGGKTLKLTAGVELAFADTRPSVLVKGISVWGVPLPNAWIGGIKNIDLVESYGDAGFWKAFAAGVENVKVSDGQLMIQLKP